MGGYFDRGASAGGSDKGYFDREDITGPEGVGSRFGGPGGVAHENYPAEQGVDEKDGIEFGSGENPYIAKAVPNVNDPPVDETAGTDRPADGIEGTYPDIVEGSDSPRTGTSWGSSFSETEPTVHTPQGFLPEGEGPGQAHINRNHGDSTQPDPLDNVGGWSTMGTGDSSGGQQGS